MTTLSVTNIVCCNEIHHRGQREKREKNKLVISSVPRVAVESEAFSSSLMFPNFSNCELLTGHNERGPTATSRFTLIVQTKSRVRESVNSR